MTTKIISTYIAAGYTVGSNYSDLTITSTGGVGGNGVYAISPVTITNAGTVNNTRGFFGIDLEGGGDVVNQQTGFIGGLAGIADAGGHVTNYGTIEATGGYAIHFSSGGTVSNGSYGNLNALIAGHGITFNGGVGTLSNFAAIRSDVYMQEGGQVTNGAVGDTTALIFGGHGSAGSVVVAGAQGTVANFGTIQGYGGIEHSGVSLGAGGSLTNGTAIDRSALVEGYTGVTVLTAAGTVTNFGTILGDGLSAGERGVYLGAGGKVINGGGGDRSALIEGANGVVMAAAGTVANFGIIDGATAYGVQLSGGGVVTNGSLNNGAAVIEGYIGLDLAGPTTATNFGTISGTGDFGGAGAAVHGGVSVTNGAAGHAHALITGFAGVVAYKTGNTVTNFGTISGTGGTAVQFKTSTDVLVVEAGCEFDGAVLGGGGTLNLDTGVGKLTGLLAGGNVTVSGSMATTTFTNFATVEIGAAATFTSSGAVTIAAGQAVLDAGSLTLGTSKTTVTNAGLIEADAGSLTIKGALKNTGTVSADGGTLTVNGAVTGGGSATINGGTLDLTSSFTENVSFLGTTGILELAQSQGYSGKVSGFSKTGGTSLDLVDIAFVGAGEATYSGTKTGGVLTVTDGTHTAHINLTGDYRTSTFIAASDGHGGVIIHDPPKLAAAAPHAFIAAMAGLGAAGAGSALSTSDWRHAIPAMFASPRPRPA